MIRHMIFSRVFCFFLVVCTFLILEATSSADAPIFGIDSQVFQKANSGVIPPFGAFDDPGAVTFNGFDSIEIDVNGFGGFGGQFYGQFGPAFDVNDYQIELKIKKYSDNTADEIRVVMSQHDGGFQSGQSRSEDFGFRFLEIDSVSDTDFVTLTRDITELQNPVTGSVFEPWDTYQTTGGFLPGDMLQDYDSVEGGNRNGLWRMQIQSATGLSDRLHVDVESVRLVPKTSEPEVARFDGKTGISQDFFALGVVDQSNGNLVINGIGSGFPSAATRPVKTSFDGSSAVLEVKVKLGASNTMPGFSVIMKDLDGNDDASGQGAEEYGLFINEELLNTSTFVTVSRPISEANLTLGQASGFFNTGDGDLVDFDLFTLAVLADFANNPGGRLDVEIESIKIIPAVVGDANFDSDNDVDGSDFLVWQRGLGTLDANLADGDANNDQTVDAADLAFWKEQFGSTPTLNAVPEPCSLTIFAWGVLCLSCVRRTTARIL